MLVKKFFFLQGHINIVIQRKSDSLMMSVNTNTMHLVMQTHSNYPFKLLVETYRLQGPCNYLFIFLQCSTFRSHWLLMYYWILWNIQLKCNNKIKWALLYSNWDNFMIIFVFVNLQPYCKDKKWEFFTQLTETWYIINNMYESKRIFINTWSFAGNQH